MLKKLKISQKLVVSMILIGIIPLLIGILISSGKVSKQLEEETSIKLEAIQKIKANQLAAYIDNLIRASQFIVETEIVRSRFQVLKAYHDEMQVKESEPFPVNTDTYRQTWERLSPKLLQIQEAYNLHNIYIICAAHGHVMYSNKKLDDLGTNLRYGQYKNTGLAKAWSKAVETSKIAIVDFESYPPADNNYMAFIAIPFKDQSGNLQGTLVVQVDVVQINHIMHERIGLGKTGENYLVGEYNGRTSLRCDLIVKKGKIGDSADDKYIQKALTGESGRGVKKDSSGKEEVIVYKPLQITGLKWCIISTINHDELLESAHNMRDMLLVIALAIAILVGGIGYLLARTIGKPITTLVERVKGLSSGKADLTRRIQIDTRDELGELGDHFNRFIVRIQEMIKSIKKITDSLSSGVLQISSSAEEMSSTAEEQSNQSQSVSTSMTELTATSDDISKSIENTRSTAEESSQMTKNGSTTIQKSIDSLKSIEDQTHKLGEIISKLGESTQEIGNIIDVINDVADQTNLLALNAAIEATRAGDAGRGFAVVADEVRKLAERTAKATKEIEAIITQLQQEAGNADFAMSNTAKEVKKGTQLGQESLHILDKIVLSSDNIFNAAISVASAVSQENATIEEVNNSIQGIAAASEEAANAIQEVASTTDDLAKQSEKLKQMVDQFIT